MFNAAALIALVCYLNFGFSKGKLIFTHFICTYTLFLYIALNNASSHKIP